MKRLYVISSLHLSDDPIENSQFRLEEILEVRLRLIEALILKLGKGSYFSDGMYEFVARSLNNGLTRRTLREIREANKRSYELGGDGFRMYDIGRVAESFKHLEGRGVKFRFRTTEDENGLRRPLEERDAEIVASILRYGSRENILFAGIAHRLEPLYGSGLAWHHTSIVTSGDTILVGGDFPKELGPLKPLPKKTKSGMSIEYILEYV